MIVDVGNQTIDFKKVERVSNVRAYEPDNPDTIQVYIVHFDSGNEVAINITLIPRKEFIALWKKSKGTMTEESPRISSIAEDDFEFSEKIKAKEKAEEIIGMLCEESSSIEVWWSNIAGKLQESFLSRLEETLMKGGPYGPKDPINK